MKKMQWLIATGVLCGATAFTACSDNSSSNSIPSPSEDQIDEDDEDDENPEQTEEKIASLLRGKWIVEELNNEAVTTNNKIVYTFTGNNKAFVSASLNEAPEDADKKDDIWSSQTEYKVSIKEKTVTLSREINKDSTEIIDLTIKDISFEEIICTPKLSIKTKKGTDSPDLPEITIRLVSLLIDYSDDIVALWEGHSTSEKDEYSDGKEHRWEFKKNGKFTYYVQDEDDKWIASTNTLNEYFVDGKLLCIRWIDDGKEYREWWEIDSFENNIMTWTALRKDKKGKTYTASFELRHNAIPTQEVVQKKIIGKWILDEEAGEPLATNDKSILTIDSKTKGYLSFAATDEDIWANHAAQKVTFEDNNMILEMNLSDDNKLMASFIVDSIFDSEFYATLRTLKNSTKIHTSKVSDDYSEDIVATWEFKASSRDSKNEHRLQFKENGDYVFYTKSDDKWVAVDNEVNEYFVDGNLICMRWINEDGETRECWEIESIKDGVMNWIATRKDKKGKTSTETLELEKVKK